MHPLRAVIRRFDDWLSSVEGVRPFADDPRLILRLQEGTLAWDVPLPDVTLLRGSPALVVHLWNERMPVIGPPGPDLAWALRTERLTVHSFHCVGDYLATTPRLDGVRAVGGTIAQIQRHGPDGGRALLEHLGFSIFPYHRPAGAFGEFWENFYTWWLMWTYNPASIAHRGILHLQRNEFWMSRAEFLHRFQGS